MTRPNKFFPIFVCQLHGRLGNLYPLLLKNLMILKRCFDLFAGLRKHPNSLLINKEYFKFELLAAELNRERSMTVEELLNSEDKINSPNEEQLRDAMTTSKVAAIVFENIKQSRPFDYDLIASCWEICQGFDFAKDLEKEIESYMREKFERKERKSRCGSRFFKPETRVGFIYLTKTIYPQHN